MELKKKSSFTGKIGFIISAAASAVGVGNLWRFPYLAAQDGGGLFVLIYIIGALTFGLSLLITDVAIGRKTGKSSIHAYAEMGKKWKFLGIIACIIPAMIIAYYPVIGGWILKYIVTFISGQGELAADGGNYFGSFIASQSSVVYCVIFTILTGIIVCIGVENGIEKSSTILMPILLVLLIMVAFYSLTLKSPDGTRTGLDGLKILLIPNLTGMTVSKFLQVLLDAVTQLFFSLSVAMGIMITYGSYMKKDNNIESSSVQVVIVDTVVAILAGVMIIPAIYVFQGIEGMKAGPSLMFISLPMTFKAMGPIGIFVAIAFFILATFAALTSAISLLEAVVANIMDITKKDRKVVAPICSIAYVILAGIIALGYSNFYFEATFLGVVKGQLLDIFDYISNNVLMPFLTIFTAILVGYVVKPQWIISEVEIHDAKFKTKNIYKVLITFVIPVVMTIILLKALTIIK